MCRSVLRSRVADSHEGWTHSTANHASRATRNGGRRCLQWTYWRCMLCKFYEYTHVRAVEQIRELVLLHSSTTQGCSGGPLPISEEAGVDYSDALASAQALVAQPGANGCRIAGCTQAFASDTSRHNHEHQVHGSHGGMFKCGWVCPLECTTRQNLVQHRMNAGHLPPEEARLAHSEVPPNHG